MACKYMVGRIILRRNMASLFGFKRAQAGEENAPVRHALLNSGCSVVRQGERLTTKACSAIHIVILHCVPQGAF